MFVGHFGLGFGAKAAAPRTSLGSLLLASQFADLLWPVLLLLGIERVRILPGATKVTPLYFDYYPFSHSLIAVFAWSLLVAVLYQLIRHYSRGAIVIGLTVLSHWFLDAIVHQPDLPIFPNNEIVIGLGLWSSLVGTIVVELFIFFVGVILYLRTTEPSDAVGKWSLRVLIAFLASIYLINLFGPPPPNTTVLVWVGHLQWFMVLWGYWMDRHRRLRH